MRDRFPIDIVLAMYTWTPNNGGFIEPRCGFLRGEDKKIYLPSRGIIEGKYASEIIVDIVKQLIRRDIRNIDIIPLDFLDPIDTDEKERVVTLAYKVMIQPSVPIYTNIEFFNYEELRKQSIAKRRDIIIFRRGLS